MTSAPDMEQLELSLKRAAAALQRAEVQFMVAGSLACWARGGPEPRKDLDLMVRPEDAERALEALVGAGMRPERPPENWLLKAYDGDLLVDLIFHGMGLPVDDDLFARAERLNVFSIEMLVTSLEDVLITKLLALTEHELDYSALLQITRAVREQVDWREVRGRTQDSPYARAFFSLLTELDIVTGLRAEAPGPHIRVVPG
jgi:hypothetical protein